MWIYIYTVYLQTRASTCTCTCTCILYIFIVYIARNLICYRLYSRNLLNMDMRQRRPSYDYKSSFWPLAGIIIMVMVIVGRNPEVYDICQYAIEVEVLDCLALSEAPYGKHL